jgi:hypothetical protein
MRINNDQSKVQIAEAFHLLAAASFEAQRLVIDLRLFCCRAALECFV